jgi:phosphocarrier protein
MTTAANIVDAANEVLTRRVVIQDIGGLHTRTVFSINRFTRKLNARITITANGRTIERPPGGGFSVLQGLNLGLTRGTEIVVSASGPDARKALDVVEDMLGYVWPHEEGCRSLVGKVPGRDYDPAELKPGNKWKAPTHVRDSAR